jgi:hypothetical protein
MFNVCLQCGQYSVEKRIDPSGPFAICPHCGHGQLFLQQPLFVVTGASGAGKSSVALPLVEVLRREAVVLDTDILWRPEFATPEDNYRSYRELWLRLATNIGQSGLPVVLVGTAVPDQFEHLPERRYFSTTRYLGLVADDEELTRRLRARPAWRSADSPKFIGEMLQFNQWLKDHAGSTSPPITLLNTTAEHLNQTVQQVADWFRALVSPSRTS